MLYVLSLLLRVVYRTPYIAMASLMCHVYVYWMEIVYPDEEFVVLTNSIRPNRARWAEFTVYIAALTRPDSGEDYAELRCFYSDQDVGNPANQEEKV